MFNYSKSLHGEEGDRYLDKTRTIKGIDPYKLDIKNFEKNPASLPVIDEFQIYEYFVNGISAYTHERFRNFKSFESYNQSQSGWVSGVCRFEVEGTENVIVRAKVMHSQSLNLPPLQPWVIASKSGKIVAVHCNCMAGLGETCTHVGAILFEVRRLVKIENVKTVTDKPAYWVVPSIVQGKVAPKPLHELDFSSKKAVKRRMDSDIINIPTSQHKKRKLPTVPVPSDTDMHQFFSDLNKLDIKPAILADIPPYSEQYIPEIVKDPSVWIASQLRVENHSSKTKDEIISECETLINGNILKVSSEQIDKIEKRTKGQYKNKEWYEYRSGRITASNMKRVCKTSIDKPSKSVVNSVCYPRTSSISSAACNWGRDHEKDAIASFMSLECRNHTNMKVHTSGFCISKEYSFIGASPDAKIECECCGVGVLEVKCPYKLKDKHIIDNDANYESLEKTDGKLHLKRDHEHFYQIQTQIYACGASFAFYVVWSPVDVFIEKIDRDEAFIDRIIGISKIFFNRVVLPELVGGLYSKAIPHSVHENRDIPEAMAFESTTHIEVPDVETNVVIDNNNNSNKTYCFCNELKIDDYIGCDKEGCTYEWFHVSCVNLNEIPDGKWICDFCLSDD